LNKVEEFLNSSLPISFPFKPFTLNDINYTIQKSSLNKSPDFNLITAEEARSLPKRAIVHISHIYNAILRLSYFPLLRKFSTLILVPKLNKPLIYLHPIVQLVSYHSYLERLILKRILPIIIENNVLPDTQFGFRTSHSTIHQVHRLVDAISYALEQKLFCTCVFLDISQEFNKVWHDSLLYKLKRFLPSAYYLIIKSYLIEHHFQIRYGSAFSDIAVINAGVPQGGILSPILYNIYAADQPITPYTSVANYADDKVIISINNDSLTASSNLQNHLAHMENWFT